MVNVLWALLNLVIGYLLFRAGKVAMNKVNLILFFLGIAAISIQLSMHFGQNNMKKWPVGEVESSSSLIID